MSLPSKELSESALDALIVRERTRVVAPLTEWKTLAAELRAEGLVRDSASREYANPSASTPSYDTSDQTMYDMHANVRRRPAVFRWGIRTIVGTALLGTGVIIGRGMAIGEQVVPAVKQMIAEVSDSAMVFRSPKQARSVLIRSQTQYQQAAAYLAAHDTSAQLVGGPEMYQERLAALDEMLATTRAKLRVAPADPVLNQYYQSAIGAREATIQQLGQTLPAGVRLEHY